MALRIEQFTTDQSGTLDGAISAGALSMDINSAAGWPSTGDFRVIIEAEIVLVTAVSGATWTIERGVDGTNSDAHGDGAAVRGMLTQGALDQWRRDNDPWIDLRSPYRIQDINGDPIINTDFTEVNFTDGAVSSMDDGNITITKDDHAADSVSALVIAAPSTPYTITAAFINNAYPDAGSGGPRWGLIFYENATTEMVMHTIQPGSINGQQVNSHATPTSVASLLFGSPPQSVKQPMWLRMTADGTNLLYYFSNDGQNFSLAYSQLKTASFTTEPDRVGFGFNNRVGQDGSSVSLVAWNQT